MRQENAGAQAVKRFLLAVAIVAAAAAPAAAATYWPQMLHGPQHQSYADDPAISSANAPGFGVKWMANLYNTDLGSPVVAYNPTLNKTVVYAGNQRGDIFAVDASNGQLLWSTNLGVNDKIEDSPAVNPEGTDVWAGTSYNAALYKLNAATGAVECSLPAMLPINGSPAILTPPGGVETVYWSSIDSSAYQGPLIATRESDCSQVFSFSNYVLWSGAWVTAAYGVTGPGRALVFVGTTDPDSREYAVDATTGALVWVYHTDNPNDADYDIGDAATISPPGKNGIKHGVVYVNNKLGYEYAIDMQNGSLLWRFLMAPDNPSTSSSRSSAALDGSKLVFGYGQLTGAGGGGGVYALDAVTGNQLWRFTDPTEVISSLALVGAPGSEVVSFGDLGGKFYLLDLASGSALYHYQIPGYITASPAESNGTIFITGSDGFLYAFAPGGSNAAPPSTAISSPSTGTSVANPNGTLTVTGTSSDPSGVGAVEIAVQQNGVSGTWYDAAHGTYNLAPVRNTATLATPLATTSTWSFSLPVPASGGTYRVIANTVGAGHIVDRGTSTSFVVQPSSTQPTIRTGTKYVAPAAYVTATGSGFAANESVTFSLFGLPAATATADSSGNIPSTRVPIRQWTTFGPTSLTATGSSGDTTTTTIFVTNNWNQAGHDSLHSSYETQDSIINGSVSVNSGSILGLSWYYQSNAAVNASPSVSDGVAYFGNDAGVLSAVVGNTGAPLWTYQTVSGSPIKTAPAIDNNGNIIFTSTDGNLYTLNSSGQLTRSLALGGTLTSPAMNNGEIYVASSSGRLYNVGNTSGAINWSAALSGAGHSAPAFDPAGGIVAVGDDSGAVTAFNPYSGKMLWKANTGGAVVAAPVIFSNEVLVGSEDGNLYAFAEKTGALNWKHAMSGPITAPVAIYQQSKLDVADSNGQVDLVDPQGNLAHQDLTGAAIAGISDVYNNALFTQANGLVGIIRIGGPEPVAWSYRTSSTLSTAPAIVDGTVYVGAADGGLYAFTPQGANPLSKRKRTVITVSDGNNWSCTTTP